MYLDELEEGNSAYIVSLNVHSELERRLLDIGFVEGTKVTCLYRSYFHDPIAYLVKGAVIALRVCDAKRIMVRP